MNPTLFKDCGVYNFMIMKKILPLVLLFFSILVDSSAQINVIKGQIIDEDNNPVSYANIGIANTQIGTASNEQGYFELIISQVPDSSELQVSAISHKTFTVKLSDISNPEELIINLEYHYVQMKEVEVNARDENAKNIVRKALNARSVNYTNKKYQLKGFYRELIRNDKEYVTLTEAAFTVDDKGYHKRDEKRFRLDALRKSDDLREMDSLDIHYDTLVRHNDLMSMFNRDYIDAKGSQWSFFIFPYFNESMVENFDFLLDSMAYYDNHLVYCISFFYNHKTVELNSVKKVMEYSQMFIRTDDYALIEMTRSSAPKEVTKTDKDVKGNVSYTVDGRNYGKLSIKYKQYHGKWYPHLITSHSSMTGGDRQKASRIAYEQMRASGSTELDFTNTEYNGRKLDPDKNNYYKYRQLLITQVFDHRDKYQKIRRSELMQENKNVRNYHMPYNPRFWKDFNKTLMNSYLKAAQRQLQKNIPLEEQFKKNGQ